MKQGIILLIIFLGLIAGIRYYQMQAEVAAEKADNYQRNNALLLGQLRRVYAEKIRLSEENEILETMAKADEEKFDWYVDISNSAVIKRLQGKGGRMSTNSKGADKLY
jgi:hypothetical protein